MDKNKRKKPNIINNEVDNFDVELNDFSIDLGDAINDLERCSLKDNINKENDDALSFKETIKENIEEILKTNPNVEAEVPIVVDKKTKSKNSILYTIGFLVFNILVVLVMFLLEKSKNNSIESFSSIINSANAFKYLFYALCMSGVVVICETLCYIILIYKADCGFRPLLSFRNAVLGKFYELATPLAIGSQPYQMYYLAKNKVKSTAAMSIPLVKLIVFILATNFVIIIAFASIKVDVKAGVVVAAAFGILFNLIFPFVILLFIVNRKIGTKIIQGVVKIGVKLHIVKNYEEKIDKINKKIYDFITSMRYLASNPAVFITIILIAIIELFATSSIPFFIIRALDGGVNYFDSFVKILYISKGGSLTPTPGAAGGVEYFFYLLYSGMVETNRFFFLLIIWRFFNTYLYMILGIIVSIYDTVKDVLLSRRQKN